MDAPGRWGGMGQTAETGGTPGRIARGVVSSFDRLPGDFGSTVACLLVIGRRPSELHATPRGTKVSGPDTFVYGPLSAAESILHMGHSERPFVCVPDCQYYRISPCDFADKLSWENVVVGIGKFGMCSVPFAL